MRIAALLGEDEFVLCCQPQTIDVAAMQNDDVARAQENLPAVHTIIDDCYLAAETLSHRHLLAFIRRFFFVARLIYLI